MRTNCCRLWLELSVIGATFAGCASPQSAARLDVAQAEFDRTVRPARMMVQFDLAKPGGLTPKERERREAAAAKAFSPACVKPYTENLIARVDRAAEGAKASRSITPAEGLPNMARSLDRDFDRCMARFGVVGYNYFELEDGREKPTPVYLEEMLVSLRAYRDAWSQTTQEEADSLALLGATMAAIADASSANVNPNQTRVSQYRRRDGTLVRSHWRTNPNETCQDNIRGCR
jgi:hypothetical protein